MPGATSTVTAHIGWVQRYYAWFRRPVWVAFAEEIAPKLGACAGGRDVHHKITPPYRWQVRADPPHVRTIELRTAGLSTAPIPRFRKSVTLAACMALRPGLTARGCRVAGGAGGRWAVSADGSSLNVGPSATDTSITACGVGQRANRSRVGRGRTGRVREQGA